MQLLLTPRRQEEAVSLTFLLWVYYIGEVCFDLHPEE